MATVSAWWIISMALLCFGTGANLMWVLLWFIDKADRAFNPRTRERIRRHNKAVAEFRREIEKHNSGRH